MENWLQKKGYSFEIQTATDGGKLYFVKHTVSKFDDSFVTISKYVRKYKPSLKVEFRANYQWIAIHEPKL